MKTTVPLAATLAAATFLATIQQCKADHLRYLFDFETSSDGLNGGLFYNAVTGADAQGADTNSSSVRRGLESAERAGLPRITPGNTVMRVIPASQGFWEINLSGDEIALGDFRLTMRIDVFVQGWDDLLSFATVAKPSAEYGLRVQHGPAGEGPDAGKVALTGFSTLINTEDKIAANSDENWHTYDLTGTTVGNDAVIRFKVDGTHVGDVTAVGGANDTITVFYLGARHPDTASPGGRNVSAVFDEVRISTVSPPPTPPAVAHYWSFNTADEVPVTAAQGDRFGNSDLEHGRNGTAGIDNTTYGPAFGGADRALITTRMSGLHLTTDEVMDANAFQWGDSSFAFSYWAYDDTADNDQRGPRVFDCLEGTTTGIAVSTNGPGLLNVRIDDNTGASFQSKDAPAFAGLIPPRDQWVHVAVNVDRTADELTIYIDGVSQGTADLSVLTGEVFATRELQVGVINDGVDASAAQHQGLDDLAFYPGLLSRDQVTALAGATTTPLAILPGFASSSPIAIVSVSCDAGEITVVFASENGKTYSVFGGTDLTNPDSWPEVSSGDLLGNGSNLSVPFTPPESPARFFLQVRED